MAKKKRRRKPKPMQRPLTAKQKVSKAKVFFDQILEIAEIFGAREALQEIPEPEVLRLYQLRFRTIKVRLEQKEAVRGFLGSVRKQLDAFLDGHVFNFPGFEQELTYRVFYSHVNSLFYWFDSQKSSEIPHYHKLKEKLSPLYALMDSTVNPEITMAHFLEALGFLYTERPDLHSFYFSKEAVSVANPADPSIYYEIIIKVYRPKMLKVKFDGGDCREAFYVAGWKGGDVREVKLDAATLCGDTILNGLKIDVFIQRHAMDRLFDRLDVFDRHDLYRHVSTSVEMSQVIQGGQKRGLLGFYFYGHLLGYLVTEMAEGVAVIRTFLFLTNDGTPQGKKLKEKLGVNKLDKSYTGLDQLSTFIYGNLKEDEKLYSLLKEAGCSILLNLNEKLIERAADRAVILDAQSIRKYFELNDE